MARMQCSVFVRLRAPVDIGGLTDGCFVARPNRLAPVGVCAVGGVNRSGTSRQGRQLGSSVPKGTEVLVQRLQMVFQQTGYVLTGRGAFFPQVENRGDFAERESGRLGVTNEAQSLYGALLVVAISVWRPRRAGKDTDVLVVPYGLGRHARPASQFAYLHWCIVGLDLPVGWKVYKGTGKITSRSGEEP